MNPEINPEIKDVPIQNIEQKFNKLQNALAKFVNVSVPKVEADLFKDIILNLQKSAKMGADQVEEYLNKLSRIPFSLHQRSAVLQIIVYGWIIKKFNASGAAKLKESLLKKYFSLVNIQNSKDHRLQQVLSVYNFASDALKKGDFVPGDPLNDSPANITLDKSFYSGTNPNDVLPLGVQESPFIPEQFRELIKNADALQLAVIKIMGENVYNPLVKWYNGRSRGVQMAVYPSISVCRKFFINTIELFSAKRIAKMISGAKTLFDKKEAVEKKFAKHNFDFFEILMKTINPLGSTILPFLKQKFEKGKSKTTELITSVLSVAGSVFDIAARDPRAMKRERAGKMPRPDCYIQNKLFILALMQHKNAQGIQKYLVEFIAMTISNFKNDDELRAYLKGLEPSLRYLFFNTGMGKQLAKNLPISKTWEKMNKVEKEEIFNSFYEMLSGAVLSAKEKNSSQYKAITAMNDIFIASLAKYVEAKPDDAEKANMLLSASILLKNITSHLISAAGSKEKADRMIDKLITIIKILKTRISANEKQKLIQINPALVELLNNPELIRTSLKGVVKVAVKTAPPVEAFVTALNKRIEAVSKGPLKDIAKIKQEIVKYNNAYKLLENEKDLIEEKIKQNILKGPLLANAKARLAAVRQQLLSLQGSIRSLANYIKDLHERGVELRNLAQLLKNTANPEVVKSLIGVITSLETANCTEYVKSKISSAEVLFEALSASDRSSYLYISNYFTERMINFSGNLYSSIPGGGTAFKLLVLNAVKSEKRFESFRKNPARFLSDLANRNQLKQLIINSMQESIKHSRRNYEVFRNKALPIISNAISKLLTLRIS